MWQQDAAEVRSNWKTQNARVTAREICFLDGFWVDLVFFVVVGVLNGGGGGGGGGGGVVVFCCLLVGAVACCFFVSGFA